MTGTGPRSRQTGSPTATRRAVVVVGGGVMGAATAYHLARAGVGDVTLLEAGELASGSSGKPLGGVRAQFSDPTNIALGQRSLGAYARFSDELGVDIGWRRVGYLFALRDPAGVPPFEASVALQNAMGVPSRMVEPAEAVGCPPCSTVDRWWPGPGARPRALPPQERRPGLRGGGGAEVVWRSAPAPPSST